MLIFVFFLFARVLDLSGDVEFLKPGGTLWMPLLKSEPLAAGAEVRTSPAASAYLVLGGQLESAVCLREDTYLKLAGQPGRHLALEKGKLFLLREKNNAALFFIVTPLGTIEMGSGGFILETTNDRMTLQLFAGQAAFKHGSVLTDIEEGHSLTLSSGIPKALLERMNYSHYEQWKAWIQEWYDKKYDHFVDIMEKEWPSSGR